MKFYIGCSGFHYKEWKEMFYPAGLPVKDWFKYYCSHYNTIEINSAFYRGPTFNLQPAGLSLQQCGGIPSPHPVAAGGFSPLPGK
ncbi:MAG: DUF72 domain-containing protein [Leadbetterella sp.]|nr:DUF72 domain-containing protein [Leadbetterella sp.]